MNDPAEWYRQSDGRQRYWDGEFWTEQFAPGVPIVAKQAGSDGGNPALPIGGSGGRRLGGAEAFGWGGLALVVLIGALRSGFSGAVTMLGLFALVVG